MWKGAADILKPSPATISAIPTTTNVSPVSPCDPIAEAMPSKEIFPVAPYTSAEPKRSVAAPKEPMTRYFRPASSAPSRS